MTIKIEIEVPADYVAKGGGGQYLGNAMSALGFHRGITEGQRVTAQEFIEQGYRDLADAVVEASEAQKTASEIASAEEVKQFVADAKAHVATRKRGEPSPGKARRTKAEREEDDQQDQIEAQIAANALQEFKRDGGTSMADLEAELAISTGEARVGPEDDEATAAQDAADEAAEADAKREPGKLTHDDLRHALGSYQKKHGMAEAVKAVQPGGLIGRPVIEVPEDELEGVIAKLNGEAMPAVSKVEPAFDKTSDTTAHPAWTKADLMELMKAYVAKYGKQAGDEDGPKINEVALGKIPEGRVASNGQPATKWVWSVLPDDPESIANLVKWWASAIHQAPKAYGRKAVS